MINQGGDMDCIFCKIRDGEIPAEIIYDDDDVLAFRDINPKAPVHVLLIPKTHIATVDDLDQKDAALVGNLVLTAKQIARNEGLDENGYRMVINCREHGGQEVYHLHLHLLGGRRMSWPPG